MNDTPTGSDAQPADSSAAPVDTSAALQSMDRAQRREFFRTGELTPSSDAPAESSPAQADGQPGSTEPSSEAASKPASPRPQRPAKNLKTRNAEIDAENAELQRKLEIRRTLREELSTFDRRSDAKPADSSPATPTKAEWQRYREMPNAPQPDQFESYEDYTAAMGVFVADQRIDARTRQSHQHQQYAQRERDIEQIATTARTRIQQAMTEDPEYVTKVNPDLLEIPTVFALPPHVAIGPHHVLATEMARSPALGKLMIYFSTPEGQQEWIRLCGLSSTELLRGFGRIEARFDAPVTSPASPVTQAPTPRAPLGRRAADPVGDSADHAVKSGDFRAYREAENRREMTARR